MMKYSNGMLYFLLIIFTVTAILLKIRYSNVYATVVSGVFIVVYYISTLYMLYTYSHRYVRERNCVAYDSIA